MPISVVSVLPAVVRVRLVAFIVMLAVGCMIVMAELDRLIRQSIADGSASYSLNALSGPGGSASTGAWAVWIQDDVTTGLVTAHTWTDIVFLLAYVTLGVLTAPRIWVLIAWLAAGWWDLTEDLLFFAELRLLPAGAGDIAGIIPIASGAKWALFAFALLSPLLLPAVRMAILEFFRLLLRAVWYHRFAAIVTVAVGTISLVPAAGVLDQLPDAQRAWAGDVGIHQPVLSMLGTVLLTWGGLALARQRVAQYRVTWGQRRAPGYFYWMAPAIAAIATAALMIQLGRADLVSVQTAVFVGVIAGIVSISFALHVATGENTAPPIGRPGSAPLNSFFLMATGNVIALLLLAVGGLSLLRSFAAPAALQLVNATPDANWLVLFWPIVGLTVAIIAFPLLTARLIFHPNDFFLGLVPPPGTAAAQRLRIGLIAIGVLIITLLTFFPIAVSHVIGVVATTNAGLLGWSLVIGAASIELGGRKPLHVFQRIGLSTDPLIAFMIVLPLIASVASVPPQLHAIERASSAQTLGQRSTLEDAVAAWLGQADSRCVQTLPDGTRIRPLILAAAEGGGIRAAAWTADAYSALMADGECGSDAVFLSSGVSGGSVGLTLFRSEHPAAPRSNDERVSADDISDPDALGAIMASALTGDLLSGSTGIMIPTPSSREGVGSVWQDRAGQLQSVWRTKAQAFAYPYSHVRQAPTGYLVLNSTTASQCRVLISQLDLGLDLPATQPTADGGRAVDCTQPEPGVSGSIDLETVYAGCPLGLDWATAALLSARFPIVSPDGRVDRANLPDTEPCRQVPLLQLVDGGYADNSGLGTIADVSSTIMSAVTAHNSEVQEGGVWVVPIVMWVSNEPGSDIVEPPADSTPSFVVPLETKGADTAMSLPGRWLQRLSDSIENPCPGVSEVPAATPCQVAVEQAHACVPYGVVVIAPPSTTTISAPLGWSLSQLSRDSIRDSVDKLVDARRPCAYPTDDLDGRYATFSDLLRLLPPTR